MAQSSAQKLPPYEGYTLKVRTHIVVLQSSIHVWQMMMGAKSSVRPDLRNYKSELTLKAPGDKHIHFVL
jgi:hypothetical protein